MQTAFYWRATTLDVYADGRWLDVASQIGATRKGGVDLLTQSEPLLRGRARRSSRWVKQTVTIDALQRHPPARRLDPRRVLAGRTCRTCATRTTASRRRAALRAARPELPGLELRARSRRRSSSSARSRLPGRGARYLEVDPQSSVPRRSARPAGQRDAPVFAGQYPELLLYRPLYRKALAIAGTAKTPVRAPRSRSRRGSGRAAVFTLRRDAAAASPGVPRARRLRPADASRLLPALRRRDGADAPLPRRPRAGGGRLHERQVRRRQAHLDGDRPRRARLGRGLVPAAGAGCRSTRRPVAGSSPGRTRRASPHFDAARRGGAAGFDAAAVRLRLLGRKGADPRSSATSTPQGGGGSAARTRSPRTSEPAALLALVLAAALLLVVAVKLSCGAAATSRATRAASPRPARRRAGRLTSPTSASTLRGSATPHELAAIVGKDFSVDARAFAAALAERRASARPRGRAAPPRRRGASCARLVRALRRGSRARSACSARVRALARPHR